MDRVNEIMPEIREYLVWGPEHYVDAHWDLTFLKIDYHNQRIELGDANSTRIFDKQHGKWLTLDVDFSKSNMLSVLGTVVPVMPKTQLIEYKSILSRNVDRTDLAEIK